MARTARALLLYMCTVPCSFGSDTRLAGTFHVRSAPECHARSRPQDGLAAALRAGSLGNDVTDRTAWRERGNPHTLGCSTAGCAGSVLATLPDTRTKQRALR